LAHPGKIFLATPEKIHLPTHWQKSFRRPCFKSVHSHFFSNKRTQPEVAAFLALVYFCGVVDCRCFLFYAVSFLFKVLLSQYLRFGGGAGSGSSTQTEARDVCMRQCKFSY